MDMIVRCSAAGTRKCLRKGGIDASVNLWGDETGSESRKGGETTRCPRVLSQ